MQEKLIEWLSNDPTNNMKLLWSDYLPNDPYCHKEIKQGRSKLLTTITRCDICREEHKHNHNIRRIDGCRMKCNVMNNVIEIDNVTNIVIGMSILECLIPDNINMLQSVYKCQDRVSIVQHPLDDSIHINPNTLYNQVCDIVDKLSSVNFSIGCISHDTVRLTNKGIVIYNLIDASYNINKDYMIIECDRPIHDIHRYNITLYPSMHVNRYFKLYTINDRYAIPRDLIKTWDFYRLLMYVAVYHHEDITTYNWFKDLFLHTELSRVLERIKKVKKYIKDTNNHVDMIFCLFDKQGCFSLKVK